MTEFATPEKAPDLPCHTTPPPKENRGGVAVEVPHLPNQRQTLGVASVAEQETTTLEKLKDLYEDYPDELVKEAIDEIERLSRDKRNLHGAVLAQRNHIKELRQEMREAGIWKHGERRRRGNQLPAPPTHSPA